MPPYSYPMVQSGDLLSEPIFPFFTGADFLKLAAVALTFVWIVRKAGR